MKDFTWLDSQIEELILGSQGDYCENIINFAKHLKLEPNLLSDYIIDLLSSKSITEDWGNLGSFDDKIGITESDRNSIIEHIKTKLS